MQPSNEHCSPSLPFPSPLLLSARAPLPFPFPFLPPLPFVHRSSSWICPLPARERARNRNRRRYGKSGRDGEQKGREAGRRGERREEGAKEGRGRRHTHTDTYTRVVSSFSFRSSRLVNIRGRGVPEIGVRHEIEGSVASNMLGRINEVVARRRLRK